MNEYRKNLLKIQSPSMGQLVIQPYQADFTDIQETRLLLFPYRIRAEQIDIVAEWAVSSQCPIFCHAQDIPQLEKEGFGAYRFHRLNGYRNVGFQGGSIELFPIKEIKKYSRFMRPLGELWDSFWPSKKIFAYHALIKPLGEKTVLLLASPHIDPMEWPMLMRTQPDILVTSPEFPKEAWQALADRFQVTLHDAAETPIIDTKKEKSEKKDGAPWKVKAV